MDATSLRIRMLGGFSVEVDGAVVGDRAWRLRKARAVVKVAALAPNRTVHRDVVCELLWPDRPADAAANNLHQALHAARRAIGDPTALTLADDLVSLTAAAWVDIDAFEDAAQRGDPDAALALYAGELLPEDRFAPWTEARRAALEEQALDLQARAAQALLDGGDAEAAVRALVPEVARAPHHEPLRRALMRALAAAGRHQDALAEFEQLRAALRASTASEPDPQTRALYRQLLAAGAPDAEPASAENGRTRRRSGPALPTPLTSFVGRERELGELRRLVARERLVTLTGPGGAGKTRLALRIAAEVDQQLADGAWLVDLAALRDQRLVAQATATAMGLPIPANRPALDALVAHAATLRGGLVVLDTCEHVLDACAALAEALVAAGPGVRVLATSREPLRCATEVAWRVPSLVEAPRLFRERAAAMGAGPWSADDEHTIEAICWRLDRMPLAVELAAAQTSALTVGQIAARLDHALDVLVAGPRTALTRQQTLRATIDWSHALLDGDERVLFRRLAAFAGTFTLEGAEHVVADDVLPRRRVAPLLARLVDQSLVVAEAGRFRLPDPIRQHAHEHLCAAGEDDAVRRRHLTAALAVARAHDPQATGAEARPLAGLAAEHDDLRAALAFGVRADPEAALALATHLWRFWLGQSWFVEGTRWMEAVLAATRAPSRTRVEAVLAAAGLALRRGDPDAYLAHVDEAVALCRQLGDPAARAEGLQQLAIYEEYVHASDRSAALFAEAVATAEQEGAPRIAASALHASALMPWARGDFADARRRLEDAMGRLRALRDGRERFLQSVTFGMPVLPEGRDGAPRAVWEATVFPFRRLDRERGVALALANLAWVARAEGDLDAADAALAESLERSRRSGDATAEALALVHRGHLTRARGDPAAAERDIAEGERRLRALGEGRDAAVAALGRGLTRGAAGDLPGARATFARALATFEATDDLPAIASTRANWAVVEEQAGELARARDFYAGAVEAWRAQRLARWEAWAALGLGSVLAQQGAAEAAGAALHRARSAFAHAGDRHGATEAQRLLVALDGR